MEIIQDRHSRNGIIGTVIVHLLLLFLFIQFGMSYQQPPPENEGGMMINFGTTDSGSDNEQDVQPDNTSSENKVDNTSSSNIPVEDQIVAQTNVETINVKTADKKEKKDLPPVEQKIDKNLADALEAFANTEDVVTKSDGTGDQLGDQGDKEGDLNSKNYSGKGSGQGVLFSLKGRSLVSVKKPNNPTQEDGNVVVDIVVDKNGQVIKATPGARGSTTTNLVLYKMAKEAALKAKFNVKANATGEQRGQMTFVFILN